MVLRSRMSYSQTHDPTLLTYLRLRQNDRHLQIYFLERDILISIDNHKYCILEVTVSSIGSGNGLAPISRQAIT